jgi:multidrug efflux pump subunit AcrA (membrane-fusion protein)
VHKGQLLATLENQDLQAAALENQGAFEQAQAEYATATSANVPQEQQKAELDAKAAQQALEAAQKQYESRQQLFQEGALPRKDLDQAAVALAQAREQADLANRHLQALKSGGTQQALRSAGGQLQSAKGKYLGAEALLGYSEIRSPIDGVVTDRPLYPGEVASAGTPLITVMDLRQVIAKAHLPADQAALLKKGDTATLVVPGFDKTVAAKITVVSPALDPNSTTVEVWAQAPNPNRELKPGSSVQMEATARTVPDALVIPTSALLTSPDGKTSVMVVDSQSRAESREVQAGIREGDVVQITAGLNAGDEVITAGGYGLPDKTKVNVQSANAAAAPAGKSGD